MPDFILPFSSPGITLAQAGGKGLNLSGLARAGFADRVPPGFVITTDAYRAFVAANQIQDRLLALVKRIPPEDPLELDSASNEISALFANSHISPEITEAIISTYRNLRPLTSNLRPLTSNLPVAVRSSATAEDLPGLSFAGQQETYLNVVGAQAVLEAVKKCWASLWTARALGYRARNRLPPDDVTLAVVVQQMIASESSGVLFTANPLTGRRGEMVIDASFGLGEAVVAGQVEPDHYVVDSREWRITARKLGAKALAILPREGGGVDRVAREAAQQPALSDAQVIELARLAHRVADHFGAPQDIEWAWAEGKLYLLQSRPITSLYPLPTRPVKFQKPDGSEVPGVYFNFGSVQGVTDPFTPIGRDAIQMLLGGLLRYVGVNVDARDAIPTAGERLFMNVTEVARHPRLRPVLLAGLARADPGARQTLIKLIEAGRLPLEPSHGLPPRLPHVAPRLMGRALSALIAPEKTLARALDEANRCLADIQQHARATDHTLLARLTAMESDFSRAFPCLLIPMMPAIFPAIAMLSVVDRWLVEWVGAPPGAALAMMRGLRGNVTTEMNLKLWAAAQTIRADPASRDALRAQPIPELIETYRRNALPRAAQRAVQGFLDEYGMRAVTEIDLGRPRWRDDPASVFQTVRAYLQLEDPALAPDVVFERGEAEAERLAADYAARVRQLRFGLARARLLKFVVHRMRTLGAARETPKFYLIKIFDIYRSLLLDSGRDLAARGRLERAEDIFFTPLGELKRFAQGEAVDLKPLVAHARAEYERELGRRQMPRLLLSTGEAFYEGVSGAPAGPNDLVGEAVSPGVAEGLVRVVLDPRGTRLEPGEILVCPATDPGWTPLFLTAGGLVMEIGGLVTHGSVVAREYGLPAVVGVQAATTRLKTGQRVRVDGNAGRVTVLTSPPDPLS